MTESTVSFVTCHRDSAGQQEVIKLLTAQGCTATFVNNIRRETSFKVPLDKSESVKAYIKNSLVEFNCERIPKTDIEKHIKMEFKFCKYTQGVCQKCPLNNVYCSRRSYLDTELIVISIGVHSIPEINSLIASEPVEVQLDFINGIQIPITASYSLKPSQVYTLRQNKITIIPTETIT